MHATDADKMTPSFDAAQDRQQRLEEIADILAEGFLRRRRREAAVILAAGVLRHRRSFKTP